MKNIAILGSLLLAFLTTSAHAYKECTASINKIYSGDDGSIWISYGNGGSTSISATDPDQKNMLTLITAALMGGNDVILRFSSDDVICAQGRAWDLRGIWLVKK